LFFLWSEVILNIEYLPGLMGTFTLDHARDGRAANV
jgi:hypothetical protein